MRAFTLAALAAAALLLTAGCADKNTADPEPSAAPATVAAPARFGTAQKSTSPEGDVSATVYAYKVLASETRPDRKGYTYAGADIRTCLTRASARISLSWAPWSLRFADDTVAEPVSSWSEDWFSVPLYPGVGREVRVGQCIRGWAVFEVPAGARPVGVVYAPSGASATPVPLEWSVG